MLASCAPRTPAQSSTGLHIFQLDLLGIADYIVFVSEICNVCAKLLWKHPNRLHCNVPYSIRLQAFCTSCVIFYTSCTIIHLLNTSCMLVNHLYISWTPLHLYTCTPVHLYKCTQVHLYTCTPVSVQLPPRTPQCGWTPPPPASAASWRRQWGDLTTWHR